MPQGAPRRRELKARGTASSRLLRGHVCRTRTFTVVAGIADCIAACRIPARITPAIAARRRAIIGASRIRGAIIGGARRIRGAVIGARRI